MTAAQKPPRAPRKPTAPKRAAETPELTPRVARRELRRKRTREEIVQAAGRVLLRDGLSATTLDAVAKEVGLTKAALYYYFSSKDALLFEIIYSNMEAQAHAVHKAVAEVEDGGQALRAIIRETVRCYANRLDDFRLAFLLGQVAGPEAFHVAPEQLARIRPLNDLAFGETARLLAVSNKKRHGRAQVEPRIMAFLANIAAVGLLTLKGMVESVGDPLLYSDEQLVEGLARIFEAAAAP